MFSPVPPPIWYTLIHQGTTEELLSPWSLLKWLNHLFIHVSNDILISSKWIALYFLKTESMQGKIMLYNYQTALFPSWKKKERLNFLASRWGNLISFIIKNIRESDTHYCQGWPLKIHPFRIFLYAPFPWRTNVKDSHSLRWKEHGSLSQCLEKTYLGVFPDGNSLRNMTKK